MKAAQSDTGKNFVDEYLLAVKRAVDRLDRSSIEAAMNMLTRTYIRGKHIYIIGNGGSASTASHMACDLTKGTRMYEAPGERPRKRLRVTSLADPTALMTAIANDISYTDVFVEQLKDVLEEGDCVIAISASGNSPNIVRAVEFSNKRGASSIGLLGFKTGGKLAKLVDCAVIVDNMDYGPVEDIHLILNHIFTMWIAKRKDAIDAQYRL